MTTAGGALVIAANGKLLALGCISDIVSIDEHAPYCRGILIILSFLCLIHNLIWSNLT